MDEKPDDTKTFWKVTSPLILFVGTVGNGLAIWLLYRSKLPTSFHVYLMAQAVCDLMSLYFGVLHRWIKAQAGFDYELIHSAVCKVSNWLTNSFCMLSVWLLAAMSMQRAVQESWSDTSQDTRRQTVAVMAVLIILILTFQSYQLSQDIEDDLCKFSKYFERTFLPTMGWINAVIYLIVPSVCIVVADLFLIRAVSQNIRLSRALSHHDMSGTKSFNWHTRSTLSASNNEISRPVSADAFLASRPSRRIVRMSNKVGATRHDSFTPSHHEVQRGTTTSSGHEDTRRVSSLKARARRPSQRSTETDADNHRNVTSAEGAEHEATRMGSKDHGGVDEAAEIVSIASAPASMCGGDTSMPLSVARRPVSTLSAPPIVKRFSNRHTQSGQNFRDMQSFTRIASSRFSSRLRHGRSKTTFSLITVTLLFIVLATPLSYYDILLNSKPELRNDTEFMFWRTLAISGVYANSAVKIFFFFLTGTVFQDEIRKILKAHGTQMNTITSEYDTQSV